MFRPKDTAGPEDEEGKKDPLSRTFKCQLFFPEIIYLHSC